MNKLHISKCKIPRNLFLYLLKLNLLFIILSKKRIQRPSYFETWFVSWNKLRFVLLFFSNFEWTEQNIWQLTSKVMIPKYTFKIKSVSYVVTFTQYLIFHVIARINTLLFSMLLYQIFIKQRINQWMKANKGRAWYFCQHQN